jgi:hypothetical protein
MYFHTKKNINLLKVQYFGGFEDQAFDCITRSFHLPGYPEGGRTVGPVAIMPKHFVKSLSGLLFSYFPLLGILDSAEKVVKTSGYHSFKMSLQGIEIIILGFNWSKRTQTTQTDNSK